MCPGRAACSDAVGKDERRPRADHELAAEQGARERKSENGVAEPGRPVPSPVLVEHRGTELTMVTTGRMMSGQFSSQSHTQQRLELQIALHPPFLAEGHLHPVVVLLELHQPARGERIRRFLGHGGGRLIPLMACGALGACA